MTGKNRMMIYGPKDDGGVQCPGLDRAFSCPEHSLAGDSLS
jgi:hypothetical protein